jgi:hypothetical protein
MAKKTRAHNPPCTYRLYIWNESWATIPGGVGYHSRHRGRCIGEYTHYKDLMADAQKRAVAAGYPKSRWGFLFDWNV